MAGIAGIHEFLDGDGGFDDEIVENSGECDEATEDGLLQHCNLNNVVNDHLGMIERSEEGLSAEILEPCIGMTFSSLDGARISIMIMLSEEKDKKIKDLYDELQYERERTATFRQQLCVILKDLEEHAQFMTLRVEDIVNSMKEIELSDL
ncbi:hypothetical protein CFP56_002387 [Quercus suber]|uniref:Uncharacterized protein n=1 Tax=Quercus suber TaxID=58331 RepID=A0AAW0LHF3_QUESU